METLLYILTGIIILMICFMIFIFGRAFENIIIIRELDEKIEQLTDEIKYMDKYINENLRGEDNRDN